MEELATFHYYGSAAVHRRANGPRRFNDGRVTSVQYGIQVSMWGGEQVLTILLCSMQSGRADCTLVRTCVDSPIQVSHLSLGEGSCDQPRHEDFLADVADVALKLLSEHVTSDSHGGIRKAVLDSLLRTS